MFHVENNVPKLNTIKYTFIFIFFISISLFVKGQENVVLVHGGLKIEGGSKKGSHVIVYKDGEKVQTIDASRKFEFELKLDHKYTIEFVKEGYITKKVSLDTYAPEDRKEFRFEPLAFNVQLFPQFDDINTVIFNQPVGKYAYDPEMEDFYYDTDYTKSIQSALAEVERKIIEKQKEKNREVQEEAAKKAAEEAAAKKAAEEAERQKAEEERKAAEKAAAAEEKRLAKEAQEEEARKAAEAAAAEEEEERKAAEKAAAEEEKRLAKEAQAEEDRKAAEASAAEEDARNKAAAAAAEEEARNKAAAAAAEAEARNKAAATAAEEEARNKAAAAAAEEEARNNAAAAEEEEARNKAAAAAAEEEARNNAAAAEEDVRNKAAAAAAEEEEARNNAAAAAAEEEARNKAKARAAAEEKAINKIDAQAVKLPPKHLDHTNIHERYPAGKTVEEYEEFNQQITKTVVNVDGHIIVFKHVTNHWGGNFYFKGSKTVSKIIYDQELGQY